MKSMNTTHDRVFICPLVPDIVLSKHRLSVAANNFCRNLISGQGFNTIYVYPSPLIDSSDDLTYDNNRIECVSSKQLRKRSITRKLAFIVENVKVARKIQSHSSVWFYNLPYTVLLLFWILRIFHPSIKLYLILLDYTPNQKGWKHYFNKFEKFCFQKFDGMISLANVPNLYHKNATCLPGVTPKESTFHEKIAIPRPEFLISGALGENISMLSKLLNIFSNIPEATLHITGTPPDENFVEKISDSHHNIIFHKNLNYPDYIRLLQQVTFLLSTRDPRMPENQCNFPSKIIEGLLYNRIIVSTISYPQLGTLKYLKINADSLENDIREIISMHPKELGAYANQGATVCKMFSTDVWNATMAVIENNCK